MEIKNHFEWLKLEGKLIRLWTNENKDDICDYFYIKEVLTNNGNFIGILVDTEPFQIDGSYFYKLEDIHNFTWYESDQGNIENGEIEPVFFGN